MKQESDYRPVLNRSLGIFFNDALRVSLKDPGMARFFLRTIDWQRRAAKRRETLAAENLQVPPIAIASITHRCNLKCQGCYEHALRPGTRNEMSEAKLRSVVKEARDLGISFFVLAGGEPFVRPELLAITRDFPDVLFMIFTNGLLISDEVAQVMKRQKNAFPLLSLEGCETETDARRGAGVFTRLQRVIDRLKAKSVFFGVSLTVTRSNFTVLLADKFVQDLARLGCRLFLFVEYTPVTVDTEDWVITDEQRRNMAGLIAGFKSRFKALFVSVPGDEEEFGGCLSAGRGFVHISPEGNVEPCPFVPYSDMSLKNVSLKDALKSDFLRRIRENSSRLHETYGGCALWKERDWVSSLLSGTPEPPAQGSGNEQAAGKKGSHD